jgi:hypothetical protein
MYGFQLIYIYAQANIGTDEFQSFRTGFLALPCIIFASRQLQFNCDMSAAAI